MDPQTIFTVFALCTGALGLLWKIASDRFSRLEQLADASTPKLAHLESEVDDLKDEIRRLREWRHAQNQGLLIAPDKYREYLEWKKGNLDQ